MVKGPTFWTRKSKDRALILYNFELKNLKVFLDCEETTRVMTRYHPSWSHPWSHSREWPTRSRRRWRLAPPVLTSCALLDWLALGMKTNRNWNRPYVLCLAGLARARDENQPELEQTGTGHLSTVSVFYSGNWERERNSWKWDIRVIETDENQKIYRNILLFNYHSTCMNITLYTLLRKLFF